VVTFEPSPRKPLAFLEPHSIINIDEAAKKFYKHWLETEGSRILRRRAGQDEQPKAEDRD
jgi:hypothetical protein